jgi:hypothetical protein
MLCILFFFWPSFCFQKKTIFFLTRKAAASRRKVKNDRICYLKENPGFNDLMALFFLPFVILSEGFFSPCGKNEM